MSTATTTSLALTTAVAVHRRLASGVDRLRRTCQQDRADYQRHRLIEMMTTQCLPALEALRASVIDLAAERDRREHRLDRALALTSFDPAHGDAFRRLLDEQETLDDALCCEPGNVRHPVAMLALRIGKAEGQ